MVGSRLRRLGCSRVRFVRPYSSWPNLEVATVTLRRTVRAGIAGAVLLSVALSSCTDSAATPAPLPNASTGPSQSQFKIGDSSERAIPTMPEGARKNSPQGALAFARHYVALMNFAIVSGNTESVVARSDPRCKGCRVYISAIREAHEGDASSRGGVLQLRKVTSVQSAKKVTTVLFVVRVTPQTTRSNKKAKLVRSSGFDGKLLIKIERRAQAWVVLELQGQ